MAKDRLETLRDAMRDLDDRMAQMKADIKQIEEKPDSTLTEGDLERVRSLGEGLMKAHDQRETVRAEWEAEMARMIGTGEATLIDGVSPRLRADAKNQPIPGMHTSNPFEGTVRGDLASVKPAAELRGRAMTAVERSTMPHDAKELATRTMEKEDPKGLISGWHLISSSNDYLSAFNEKMRGNDDLSREEILALRAAREYRAASLTDNAGGYAVPSFLDPNWTIALGSDGTVNDVSKNARNVMVTNDQWKGVAITAISSEWGTENTEWADSAPTFSQPTVDIETLHAYVPASLELVMDTPDLAAQLAAGFREEFMDKEAAAVVTGTGSGDPQGFITAAIANSTTSIVDTVTASTFGLADVYAVYEDMAPKHRDRAKWGANPIIQSAIRQFSTDSESHSHSGDLTTSPKQFILGQEMLSVSEMDSQVTTNSEILVFADWSRYVIARRTPSLVIEFIPHAFGANGRPTGTRGWAGYSRLGAGWIDNGESLRVLQA